MLIGLTGTPGTGKTSVSRQLESRFGYRVIDLTELIKEEKLYCEVDEERDTLVVDMEMVAEYLAGMPGRDDEVTILESHLSHHIADIVIVLRAHPELIRKRLSQRKYSQAKVEENIEAEALDIILFEAVEWCQKVFEINTTQMSIEEVAQTIDEIIQSLLEGKEEEVLEKYRPGTLDWSEEFFG